MKFELILIIQSVNVLTTSGDLVHLRIREVDQLIPKSLYPTSSGNTFWQVETESSLLNGMNTTLVILAYFEPVVNACNVSRFFS